MILKEDLPYAFSEFEEYIGQCKFSTCLHTVDKGCRIIQAVEDGDIPNSVTFTSTTGATLTVEDDPAGDVNKAQRTDLFQYLLEYPVRVYDKYHRLKDKVKEIIDSEANINFYRELEATEKDLKTRQKNLEKFWTSLQTPRVKPRQRRIDPLDRIKELPPVLPDECYAYKHEDGYRILVILDRFKEPHLLEQICVCVLNDTFSTRQADVETENIVSMACFDIDEDKKYAIKKLKSFQEYALDGIFNFRLQPLKNKWREVASYIPFSFTVYVAP